MSDLSILMVAAENDSLPGAKVGGVGDVLRDLPAALVKQGCRVQTVIPSYGFLARLPGLYSHGTIMVPFAGGQHEVFVWRYAAKAGHADAFILDHPRFHPHGESVYCHDEGHQPFATDATKFAFFSAAVAQALLEEVIPRPSVLHCHDWHSAFLLILLRYMPRFLPLANIRTVFSIHNLAMQGVRPFRGDASAFETWFPKLLVDPREIADLNATHCINPMRAGIRIADKVHTVSPSYAEEILKPSNYDLGIYGGEGLEADLQLRAQQGDLVGILNGCEYPRKKKSDAPSKATLAKQFGQAITKWAASSRELLSAHWLAEKRLATWAAKRKPGMLLTSVGRVTDQKVRLLATEVAPGQTALGAMLAELGDAGTFIMLGSGNDWLEQALVRISAEHDNFLFLNGFSPGIAETLYQYGDLFIMPSSFEPCGISQLLAMRAGQPCLVNRVGGLKDTVEADKTGFAFEGENAVEQAKAMVETFKEALRVHTHSPEIYDRIRKSAARVRFTWDQVAEPYIEQLYSPPEV